MNAPRPEDETMVVRLVALVAVGCALFAAVMVLVYLIHERNRDAFEDEFDSAIRARATETFQTQVLTHYRLAQGYEISRPSADWVVVSIGETDHDLALRHPRFGRLTVSLAQKANPQAIAQEWETQQTAQGWRLRQLSNAGINVSEAPALLLDYEKERDDVLMRCRLLALGAPRPLCLEIENDPGPFSAAQREYEAIVRSLRLLSSAPAVQSTTSRTPRPYRGGPGG